MKWIKCTKCVKCIKCMKCIKCCSPPAPQTSYPILVGLIGINCKKKVCRDNGRQNCGNLLSTQEELKKNALIPVRRSLPLPKSLWVLSLGPRWYPKLSNPVKALWSAYSCKANGSRLQAHGRERGGAGLSRSRSSRVHFFSSLAMSPEAWALSREQRHEPQPEPEPGIINHLIID